MTVSRLATLGLALVALASGSAHAGFLYLPDVNAYIQVGGQTVIGTASTYEAVLLFKSTDGSGMVLEEIQPFGEDKFFQVDPASGVYGYNNPVNGLDVLSGPVTNIALDVWHHAAYVYDGAEERLYFDGTLVASRAGSGDVNDADAPMYIGASVGHGYTTFVGLLDSVRVSNVARYVGASFTPPTGDLANDPNTLLLYNFDDPAGSTAVADSSANARTGTFGSLTGGSVPVPCGADTGDMDGDLVPDSCDPDTPTTTTTVAGTSSTTTVASTSTTSTTLPGCAGVPDGPTFASISCRLDALAVETSDQAALGSLSDKLLVPLGKARERAAAAHEACAGQDTKHAKSNLKKVVRQLIQYSHRLRSRSVRKKIEESVREPLADTADAIQDDVRALKDTLGCI
jgi:hypothetical protein